MNVLIFEDEIPAYDKLSTLIQEEFEDLNILGWGRSINEAKKLLKKNENVDLIFSDIELLDGSSFEIYSDMEVNCPIIFCTAYEQFVFEALKNNGIAYILKPYDKATFVEAVGKYKKLFTSKEPTNNIDAAVFQHLKALIEKPKKTNKQRWVIKKADGIKLLNSKDIMYLKAEGDFSFAFDLKSKHIISQAIGQIAALLDPEMFFRINRSEMVNINFIEKIEPYFKNRLAIFLTNQKDPVYTSNSRSPEFRVWLEQ